jgi:hypothetical protein
MPCGLIIYLVVVFSTVPVDQDTQRPISGLVNYGLENVCKEMAMV